MAELPDRDMADLTDRLLADCDAPEFANGVIRDGFLSSRLHRNAIIRSLDRIAAKPGILSSEWMLTEVTRRLTA